MSYEKLPVVGRGSTDRSETLPRDEIFTVLNNKRRQCAIHYLKQQAENTPIALSDLVDYVAAWENDTSIGELDPAERKRVYNALRQTHLPLLAEVGLVEYDRESNDVALTDAAEEVQLYLEYVPKHDIPWHGYYLGLSVITAALTLAVWGGVYPFSELSGFVVLGVILSTFAVSSIVHGYYARMTKIETHERFDVPDR